METKNIRDCMVKRPGMLDHTGVADSMLSMMSLNSKTNYYHVLWISKLDLLHKNLQGLQGVSKT